eukprot:434168-Pelagomonas_calceolata.AAC.1
MWSQPSLLCSMLRSQLRAISTRYRTDQPLGGSTSTCHHNACTRVCIQRRPALASTDEHDDGGSW